ncbi:MAG: hypothetical protein Q8Q59_12135 [Luteolibacter sp.]|jgi:hypothetical protein|nr:hypothetical protein [Luteolibacter sp.]
MNEILDLVRFASSGDMNDFPAVIRGDEMICRDTDFNRAFQSSFRNFNLRLPPVAPAEVKL